MDYTVLLCVSLIGLSITLSVLLCKLRQEKIKRREQETLNDPILLAICRQYPYANTWARRISLIDNESCRKFIDDYGSESNCNELSENDLDEELKQYL